MDALLQEQKELRKELRQQGQKRDKEYKTQKKNYKRLERALDTVAKKVASIAEQIKPGPRNVPSSSRCKRDTGYSSAWGKSC